LLRDVTISASNPIAYDVSVIFTFWLRMAKSGTPGTSIFPNEDFGTSSVHHPIHLDALTGGWPGREQNPGQNQRGGLKHASYDASAE
jgi:hypothetical protein